MCNEGGTDLPFDSPVLCRDPARSRVPTLAVEKSWHATIIKGLNHGNVREVQVLDENAIGPHPSRDLPQVSAAQDSLHLRLSRDLAIDRCR